MATLLAQKLCLHCGDVCTDVSSEFCCQGCSTVYGLLDRNKLESYYDLFEKQTGSRPEKIGESELDQYQYCDDASVISEHAPNGSMRFFIEGVHCSACLWLLEKLPVLCADAQAASLNMTTSILEVKRGPQGSFSEIARTLAKIGYKPHLVRSSLELDELRALENHRSLARIGIAGACAGNIMLLSVSVYSGATGALAQQFHWISSLIAIPVMTYCALPFYQSSWRGLRARQLPLDAPIVLALVAGAITSVWNLLRGSEGVYFDSLTMLVFLLLSSRFLLQRVQQKLFAGNRLQDELLLCSVDKIKMPELCTVQAQDFAWYQNLPRELTSSVSLKSGDVILLRKNQILPIDGVIQVGEGTFDVSSLTGESLPRVFRKGDRVEAGFRSVSGEVYVQVVAVGAHTRMARIFQEAEKSLSEKPKLSGIAELAAKWFTVIVVLGAVGCVVFFGIEEGLRRALTLMIVACPCVFGMAIPLSLSLALRQASRHGIFVKDASVFERLLRVQQIFFDKTGTLTTGALQVYGLNVIDQNSRSLAFSAALGLELESNHPVGICIRDFLLAQKTRPLLFTSEPTVLPKGGLKSVYKNQEFSLMPVDGEQFLSGVKGTYVVAIDGRKVLEFFLEDQVRAEAKPCVEALRQRGLSLGILSGDQINVVQACARQLGIVDVKASLSPEEKVVSIQKQPAETMMVGDGVNDVAALASASVGLAVRGSMEVSLKAADVYLVRGTLNSIPHLFSLAHSTNQAIRRNLLLSALFNGIAAVLAVTGVMTPLWAAVLMPLSSLTVLISALQASRRGGTW